MPLSEHEQKVLQQMEQALYAEDPRFASHITNHGLNQSKRRIILGAAAMVAGLVLVVLAALNALVWLGALGFVLMVAGGAYAFTPGKRATLRAVDADGTPRSRPGAPTAGGRGKQQPRRAGFMQRLEQRWDRRRDSDTW